MTLRVEAWTLPWSATFERVIADVPCVDGRGVKRFNDYGEGSIVVPGDYKRISDIISTTSGSLIRVYDGSTIVDEFLAERVERDVDEQGGVRISGGGIETVFDRAVVYPFDYPDSPSAISDWVWGGDNIMPDLTLGDLGSIREQWELYLAGERYELDTSLGSSGTFTLTVGGNTTSGIAYDATASTIKTAVEGLASVTEVTVLQPDPDTREFFLVFEDPKNLATDATANFGSMGGTGVFTKLNDGFDTGTDPTFTITVDGQTTSALAWNSTANNVEGTTLSGSGLQGLSNITDVTVTGTGVAADPWIITFFDPPDPTTVTVTFAAGTAVSTKIVEGDPDSSPVTQSRPVDSGTQDTEVHGTYDDPPVQVVTTPLDTGADWSLLVNATGRFAGSQIVLPVLAGQTYQASIRVRPTITSDFVLVIHDEFQNQIARTSDTQLTANTWAELSLTDVLIPSGVEQVVFRVAVVDTTPANIGDHYVNWQGAQFNEGQEAQTIGEITAALMDDATTDHSSDTRGVILDWVDYSGYSATVDSSSANWTQDESFVAYRGATYGQTFDRIVDIGYEWRLTPKASPSGGKTHDLEWYNSGNMDAAPAVGLTVGQGTTAGPVVQRIPEYTAVLVEGSDGQYVEDKDSTAETNFGRFEKYHGDAGLFGAATLGAAGDALLLEESRNRTAVQANVFAGPWSRPLVDYRPGDTVAFQFPPALAKSDRRVQSISWRLGEPAEYQITGSRVFTGESGAWEAVRRLLRRFDPMEKKTPRTAGRLGGGGGAFTVTVAASDASDLSKSKADIVASSDDATDAIQQAFDLLPTSPRAMGRIVLSEGTFTIATSSASDLFEVSSNRHIQGMGRLNTRISVAANATTTNRVLFDLRDGSLISDLTIEKDSGLTLNANSYTAVGLFGVRCGLRDVDILEVGATGGTAQSSVWSGNSQPYQFIDNCYIEAPKRALYAVTASEFHLTDSYLSSDDGEVVYLSGVERFFMRGNTLVGVSTDTNILMVGTCRDWWIVDNDIQAGLNGIYLDNSASGASGRGFILGNHFSNFIEECGVFLNLPNSGPAYVVIANNLIQSVGQGVSFGNAAGAIRCIGDDTAALTDKNNDQEPGLIVAHNRLEGLGLGYGIKLEAIEGALVQGNHVEDPGNHAIYVSGGDHNRIFDNLALWPQSSDAFDGVYVDADACYLSRNQVVDHSGTGPSYFRYGINIAGGTGNIVVANDLTGTGGGTGTLNDSGTSTVTTFPAGGIGANFA